MTDSNPPASDETQDDNVSDGAAAEAASAWTGASGDLPDLIELTPDLVEEEAIRGDFMLRWATILLAVLMGCGQIASSRTLVHIRSGLDMQASGFLPAAADPYSNANAGNSADNVSWLLDHILAIAWALGGATGLTVFKAIIAGIIAWQLSRISVERLPTWWNSICGVLALAACCSDLVPITDLMTLLGLTVILRLLHGAFTGNVNGLTWKLPLTIAVWSNVDPRAWLGVFAVLLFSIGYTFSGSARDRTSGTQPGQLWMTSAVSAVALLINPFPIASIMSPVHTYLVEYPALRALYPLDKANVILLDGRTEYYSLLNSAAWDGFEFAYIAALGVIAFAICALSIARDRRETPWAVLLGGFVVLAGVAIHELAAAALVAAVVAATVGQRWYQKTFPQEYTVKPSEVLFSRAGRAVTVFSFALVGFLIVTDRVPTRTPIGNGFTSDFKTTFDALSKQFESLPDDSKVLHTRAELGDFLIWSGHNSYIDSRIRPFGAPDEDTSPIHRYLALRKDIMEAALADGQAALAAASPTNGSGSEPTDPEQDAPATDTTALHAQLENEGISHVIVRLSPPGPPDYRSMRALGSAPKSWLLTDLASSAAIFAYLPNASSKPEPFDTRIAAFREVEPQEMRRFEYAHAPGFYEKHLYRSRSEVPEDLRIARHFVSVAVNPSTAVTAIRAASRVLSQDTQNADAHYTLALAYSLLASWERQQVAQTGGAYPADLRYMQVVMAGRQAVTANPDHILAWSLLLQVYGDRGRTDQAEECLERVIAASSQSLASGESGTSMEQLDQLRNTRAALTAQLDGLRQQIASAKEQQAPEEPSQNAVFVHSLAEHAATSGDITTALQLLHENEENVKSSAPQIFTRAKMLEGQLLFESGALQEGSQVFVQLDTAAGQGGESAANLVLPWYPMSFYSLVSRGLYNEAADLMAGTLANIRNPGSDQLDTGHMLVRLPIVAQVETAVAPEIPVGLRWPISQLAENRGLMHDRPNAQAEPQFMLALADMEAGNIEAAKVGFQSVVVECGQTPYQQLAGIYLTQLDEDAEDFLSDNFADLWEDWEAVGFEPRIRPAATKSPGDWSPDSDQSETSDPNAKPAPDTDASEVIPEEPEQEQTRSCHPTGSQWNTHQVHV